MKIKNHRGIMGMSEGCRWSHIPDTLVSISSKQRGIGVYVTRLAASGRVVFKLRQMWSRLFPAASAANRSFSENVHNRGMALVCLSHPK